MEKRNGYKFSFFLLVRQIYLPPKAPLVLFSVTLQSGEVDWGMKKVLRYQGEIMREGIAT